MSKYVVVGASKAGCSVTSKLLSTNVADEVVLVNGEKLHPYDKPPLSKEVIYAGKDPTDFPLLDDDELSDPRLTLLNDSRAEHVDSTSKSIRLEGGDMVSYDRLIVATGARARQPFTDAPREVFALRTFLDSCRLSDVLTAGGRLVIIGGGFIGFEVASSVRKCGNAVTIVELAPVPLQRGAGQVVGEYLSAVARDRGVDIRVSSVVESFETTDGKLSAVVLANGETIPCDACLIGVGSVPNSEWLGDTVLLDRGAIVCDENGQAQGAQDIFALGDVAAWKVDGTPVRHEHWTSAADQASRLISSFIGQPTRETVTNFVWSDQFDSRVSLYGSTGGDLAAVELQVPGADPELGIGYFHDERLEGVCVIGTPKDALLFRRALVESKRVTTLQADH